MQQTRLSVGGRAGPSLVQGLRAHRYRAMSRAYKTENNTRIPPSKSFTVKQRRIQPAQCGPGVVVGTTASQLALGFNVSKESNSFFFFLNYDETYYEPNFYKCLNLVMLTGDA